MKLVEQKENQCISIYYKENQPVFLKVKNSENGQKSLKQNFSFCPKF